MISPALWLPLAGSFSVHLPDPCILDEVSVAWQAQLHSAMQAEMPHACAKVAADHARLLASRNDASSLVIELACLSNSHA